MAYDIHGTRPLQTGTLRGYARLLMVVDSRMTANELTPAAQKVAIDHYRDVAAEFFSEDISDYFNAGSCWGMDAAALGVEFKTRTIATMGGGTRAEPIVYWELHRQGAGACFEGRWTRPADPVAQMAAYAGPGDKLHAIAAALAAMPAGSWADIKHRGHYYHAGSTAFDVYVKDHDGADADAPEHLRLIVIEALRDYMTYIYDAINAEYDYRTSDAAIRETLEDTDDREYLEDGRLYQ